MKVILKEVVYIANVSLTNNELMYWVWFLGLKTVTRDEKELLLNRYKDVNRIWNLEKNELYCIGISEKSIKDICNKNNKINLEKYAEYIQKNNIRLITLLDKEYPEKLKNVIDNPIAIWVKGNINLLNTKSIAIVGSRNCTEYGKKTSFKLARDISKNNISIISGLAKGIDCYAHLGALSDNKNTIAVVAHGLDMVYPIENKKLFNNIIKNNGVVVSEYLVGEKPKPMYFPARNRIISALSDGIVVVEASKKSGAFITVDFGIEQGKNVFAVPGNIYSYSSEGTNNLIKDGAFVATSARDIIEVCYGTFSPGASVPTVPLIKI